MCRQGRKPASESRAAELRQRLILWKQMPESVRPSLRALARELGTSHQLLEHYLDGLEIWQAREYDRTAAKEYKRKSDEILARAAVEGRSMTEWEQEQAAACREKQWRAEWRATFINRLWKIKQAAQRGPLQWHHVQMLKIYAKYRYPGAQELLQKHGSQALSRAETERALKKACLKTVVVQDERGAELQSAGVDVCDRKAVAKLQAAIIKRFGTRLTVESHGDKVVIQLLREEAPKKGLKIHQNNLPAGSHRGGKSFRTDEGKLATPLKCGEGD
jgi:hypothetical protein